MESKWNILFIFGSFKENIFLNIGENLLRVIKKIDEDWKIERKRGEKSAAVTKV